MYNNKLKTRGIFLVMFITGLLFSSFIQSKSISVKQVQIEIIEKNKDLLKFQILTSAAHVEVTVVGENFKATSYTKKSVSIENPGTGKFFIVARDENGLLSNIEFDIK